MSQFSGALRRLLALSLLLAGTASAQTLTFVGEVALPTLNGGATGGSDVWPYTAPDGAEYALMGDETGVAVVAVPSLDVVAHIDGPSQGDRPYLHRDIKTYQGHAYIVTECVGGDQVGLQVVDLSGLPDAVAVLPAVAGQGGRMVSSHNLTLDTAAGFAYVLNSGGSGVVAVDLADPAAPVDIGQILSGQVHDVYAHDDRLYVAEGTRDTFSIWDVSDKQAPVMLSRTVIPNSGYVHNIWPSDDGRYALTTEETTNKTVKVWDLLDVTDPQLVGQWLGASQLAHNVHVTDRTAYISHYTSGVSVVDFSDPANPTEVASYDTYPADDSPGFRGAWGATLPTASGYIYVSDIEGDLTVLRLSEPLAADDAPDAADWLGAPSPNPTTGDAAVTLRLSAPETVRIIVLDLRGREVGRVERAVGAGAQTVALPTAELPAGVYLVRAQAGDRVQSQRLSVVR